MRADLYAEGVLAKCEALKASGLWTGEPHVRPTAWLGNFDQADQLLASVLLDNVVFFANRASDRLLLAALERFEDDALQGRLDVQGKPEEFLDALVFTPVEGEDPRPTDSGKTLCRRLRDVARLDDGQFKDPSDALDDALAGSPIVFVDDFIGSGQQLIHSWQRAHAAAANRSFKGVHALSPFPAYCFALVATDHALRNIAKAGIPVVIRATHVLDATYSVQHLDSPPLVPAIADFRLALRALLDRYRERLVRKDYFDDRSAALGFHELGLLVAFEHGVPDSSVPVIWAEGKKPGWVPLVRP